MSIEVLALLDGEPSRTEVMGFLLTMQQHGAEFRLVLESQVRKLYPKFEGYFWDGGIIVAISVPPSFQPNDPTRDDVIHAVVGYVERGYKNKRRRAGRAPRE